MNSRARQPVTLTIAGSDSGGGAGVQADLKTFAALGVHGTSAITCLTAQNPKGVFGVQATTPKMIGLQMEAIFQELPPAAVKTGMLYSRAVIDAVISAWPRRKAPPLVVDPVLIATSGARLLRVDAERALIDRLLPLATLITPNLDETAFLVGRPLRTVDDLREAAMELHWRHGCAVLVKGGHLRQRKQAQDVFFDGRTELQLSAPFVRGVSTHGTGCTYSAAIAGYLALGVNLTEAVGLAKNHITQSIAQSVRVGRHTALNPFWSED